MLERVNTLKVHDMHWWYGILSVLFKCVEGFAHNLDVLALNLVDHGFKAPLHSFLLEHIILHRVIQQ